MALRRVTPKTAKKCPCGSVRVEIGMSEYKNFVYYRCTSPRCGFVVACYTRPRTLEVR